MAKSCSICSSTPEVQEQILKWYKDGKSYREIETSLAHEGNLSISNSSIRRHLVNCIETKKDDEKKNHLNFHQMHNYRQPDGADLHNALCFILRHGIEMFFQRMDETIDAKTPYNVHLETYKCLDLLIKMLESLYPNSARLAEIKEQKQRGINVTGLLQEMSPFHQTFLYKMMECDGNMTPQDYKKCVLNELAYATHGYDNAEEEKPEHQEGREGEMSEELAVEEKSEPS